MAQRRSSTRPECIGSGVPLIVRANIEADGLLRGWGNVGTGGELVNNGQIIADGFDHLRTLNLSSFSSVNNTIDNALGGQNGWYVQRGGRKMRRRCEPI